ncbi:GNAT family N-acetyltransferase [Pseudohoeflea suaedae]|uniref:GNAT family N-acetyltransferase n=1 Tax=Pseudohoeflea suaedae TaxID=877384 RepID=A0A4R5PM23_9HYPH|nr:GNAT family N-acetyltransferase [Pseudohoeflea suaedae]TDH37581.1 GNAT family N-acetyltransferase [Pseudohoeflea suaedae]
MTDVTIRPIGADDESEWRRLWTGYLEFYESEVSEEVYQTTFGRLLKGNAGVDNEYRGYLAEVDGNPVGLVHFLFHRHCWKVENVCYLQDLYADPDMRGQGIGRALIEAVYRAADDEGAPGVYWMTQEFNEAGRRLYDRIGKLTPFIKYNRP